MDGHGDDKEIDRPGEGEFRLVAEDDEYWAMKQARRASTLSEVAYDAMNRGDRVSIWAGARVFTGLVDYARGDLLSVRVAAETVVDVNLAGPVVVRISQPSAGPGVGPARHGAPSFRARLSELEQASVRCELVVPWPGPELAGRVSVRAVDHVAVEDDERREWFVPLAWLAAVVEH